MPRAATEATRRATTAAAAAAVARHGLYAAPPTASEIGPAVSLELALVIFLFVSWPHDGRGSDPNPGCCCLRSVCQTGNGDRPRRVAGGESEL